METQTLKDLLAGAPDTLQVQIRFDSKAYSLDVFPVYLFQSSGYSSEDGSPDYEAQSCRNLLPAELRSRLIDGITQFWRYERGFRTASGDDNPAKFRLEFDKTRNLVIFEASSVRGMRMALKYGLKNLPDSNVRVQVWRAGLQPDVLEDLQKGGVFDYSPTMDIKWLRTSVGTLDDSLGDILAKCHDILRGIIEYHRGDGRLVRVKTNMGRITAPEGEKPRGYSSMSSGWKASSGLSPDQYQRWYNYYLTPSCRVESK